MKTAYAKPIVLANEELAEGVYAASGEGCYTVTGKVVQGPATGMENYVVQVDALHDTTTHHSTAQTLTITFNKEVNFISCYAEGAKYVSGNGSKTLVIDLTYHKNAHENIGFGDLKVMTVDGSWTGLEVTKAEMACNYDCAQHNTLPNYP